MARKMPWIGCTKLLTNFAVFGVILVVLTIPQEVTSFSVGGKAFRRNHGNQNLDLAEALALLQRERRRVSDRDFIPPEEYLRSRPLTESDLNDWLSKDREGSVLMNSDDLDQYLGLNQEPTWVSEGNFEEFNPPTQTVKPSKEEIEDIFSNESQSEQYSLKKEEKDADEKSENDKKENRSNPNVERKMVKKSVPIAPPTSLDGENNLSLDTLTQEEFKALMKAVGKLQRQVELKGLSGGGQREAEMLEEVDVTGPEQEIGIVQPASKEELQSLFVKEDDDPTENEEQDDDVSDSEMVPKSRLLIEEEVQTPEGGRRILEVDTPAGGTRLTELDTPDGQQEIVEETLPGGSMDTLQDALADSESELSNALTSQLERDISQEVMNKELEAEEVEKEVDNQVASMAAQVESRQKEVAAAAKEEIEREIGNHDLNALEKMWMSQDDSILPYPEKRTTKRAARNSFDINVRPSEFASQRIPNDLTLDRLLTGSDVGDTVSADEDIINSINEGVKEAELEREILNDQDIKNALNAIKTENAYKEDIIYGSPFAYPEYRSLDEQEDNDSNNSGENDNVFGSSMSFSSSPVASLNMKRSRQFDKERLRALANALSMNSEDDEDNNDDEDGQDENFSPTDPLLSTDYEGAEDTSDELTKVFQDLGIGSGQDSHLPDEVAGLPQPLGKFVTRIVELQDEVSQLRAIAQLADLENDVLTDALNEATMAQAPGTVSDMEFESLQQAIWVEKELQKLKQTGGLGKYSFVRGDGSLARPPVSVSSRKRGEPWRRKRGKAQTGSGNSLQTFPVSSLARPSRPVTKDDIEQLLGDAYVGKGGYPEISEFGSEDDGVASIFLPNADQCPAVREYSTNCELADLYSLPVDYEARALCNLHEMCYACGHSLHVPQDACDEVYRTAAKTLCREGAACVLEAEIFLRTMKLKTRYVPHKQPACRSTCTARFLGML